MQNHERGKMFSGKAATRSCDSLTALLFPVSAATFANSTQFRTPYA